MRYRLHPERKIKIAYSPETKKWALRLNDLIYPDCDVESIKNWYAIESGFMNVNRKEDANISDFYLNMIIAKAENDYERFQEAFPLSIFPNEKYEAQWQ